MHFALPPRRSQHQAPYVARQQRAPLARRVGPKQVVLIVFAFFAVLFFLGKLSGSSDLIPAGTPEVVLVTLLDDTNSGDHDLQDIVKRNRWDYAAKHGYATFFGNYTDYEAYLDDAPTSWAKVPSIRHAMTEFPYSTFFWFLDEYSLIMNMDIDFKNQVGGKVTLERNMLVDVPVVPPDSVIHTFGNLDGDNIDLIVSQDTQGLSTSSFVVRAGDWAKFFLDAWFDPLYRSYNFQKAETHALEHIVQWHGTILAKLALVPLKMFNSYAPGTLGVGEDSTYTDGDYVINLSGCTETGHDCKNDMRPYIEKLYPPQPQ